MTNAPCTCTHTEGAHNQEGGRCALCECLSYKSASWYEVEADGATPAKQPVRRLTPREAWDIIQGALKSYDNELARITGQRERAIREALEGME